MSALKVVKTSEVSKGLAKAVEDATHPAMKRLGELALERGLSQESLAREYSERFGAAIIGANVHDHFIRMRPSRQTIERYAAILDVSSDQLHVLEHGRLSEDGERRWERYLFRTLNLFENDFEPGVFDAVTQAFRESATRSRVLAAMALPSTSQLAEWSAIPTQLASAAAALFPALDLRDFVRTGNPMLFNIYRDALKLFGDPKKADAYVRACAAIIEMEGIDTVPMLNYLRKRCSTSTSADGWEELTIIDNGSQTVHTYGDRNAQRRLWDAVQQAAASNIDRTK